MAAAGKPAESKKPYKMSGGNRSMAFIQTMFEAYVKAKKAGKTKKRKKFDCDSSDSPTVNRKLGTTTGVLA